MSHFTPPQKLQNLSLYPPPPPLDLPVRLDANESCFPLDASTQKQMQDALAAVELHRYPDPLARDVCQKIAACYGQSPTHVTAGNGSDELLSILIQSLIPNDGKVLIFDPDFDMYQVYAGLCGLTIETHAMPLPGEDLPPLPPVGGANMVLFSNPCNPTGHLRTREQLLPWIRSNPKTLFVADEAYMDFAQTDESLMKWVGNADFANLIVLKTCSKNFGAAALRLGFAFASEDLTTLLRSVKSPYNVNSLTQAAGSVLLADPQTLRERTARIAAARDATAQLFADWAAGSSVRVINTAANFINIRLNDPSKLHCALLDYGVSVRLRKGFLRVTAANEEERAVLMFALKLLDIRLFSQD